jgi:hypothetical protein
MEPVVITTFGLLSAAGSVGGIAIAIATWGILFEKRELLLIAAVICVFPAFIYAMLLSFLGFFIAALLSIGLSCEYARRRTQP